MGLTTRLGINLTLEEIGTFNNTARQSTPNFLVSDIFDNGIASGECDLAWWDKERELTANTIELLDLSGGLVDVFCKTLLFARVKVLFIQNLNETPGDILKIGGSTIVGTEPEAAFLLFDDLTDRYSIGPKGKFVIDEMNATGRPVNSGTSSSDTLKIENVSANKIKYNIAIAGSSV